MTTLTLHESVEQVRELLDQIDPETGELPAELEQARAVVATRATAVAAYIDDSDLITDAYEARAKDILAQCKARRRRVEWLKRYLLEHMAALDITELRGPGGQVLKRYVGRDRSVEVFEEALLPREYLREIPARYEPDKARIRDDIGVGVDVPGARVVARDRLVLK